MLTLDHLRADLAASGRSLTPRAARDWWTKGLLPRPQRRGLGRGKGTETFWTTQNITEQAQVVYDLLVWRPRVDVVIVGLWLLGFPVDLRRVRDVYERAHCGVVSQPPDDAASESADMFVRQNVKIDKIPADAKDAGINLAVEFFGVFYGVKEPFESFGLEDYWKLVKPYLNSEAFADMHLRDVEFETYAKYLKAMVSLPAQREAIVTASDYELTRARRFVHFVFGYFDHLARTDKRNEKFDGFGRHSLIAIGATAIPILIAAFRNNTARQKIFSGVLDFVMMIPRANGELILDVSADLPLTHHNAPSRQMSRTT
jgi:hypothetical protein